MQKILIIRFSSIGDIVLTTPIVRCLKSQIKAEVHYLTKKQYVDLVAANPFIDKVVVFEGDLRDTINKLKKENYSCIIDLHNNIRSFWLRMSIGVTNFFLKKHTIKRFLLIHLGINLINKHIVDRYFETCLPIGLINDNMGLDYFIKNDVKVDFNITQQYVTWCIGASFEQKMLSETQIIEVCNELSLPIVLIGGEKERMMGCDIVKNSHNKNIYNFCGQFSINQSALIIKHSSLVLTNDTGFMHIATSFNKKIISFWGCTKPSLGYYPYMLNNNSSQVVSKARKHPCSRHGGSCKVNSVGCVKTINSKIVLTEISKLLKLN